MTEREREGGLFMPEMRRRKQGITNTHTHTPHLLFSRYQEHDGKKLHTYSRVEYYILRKAKPTESTYVEQRGYYVRVVYHILYSVCHIASYVLNALAAILYKGMFLLNFGYSVLHVRYTTFYSR